METFIVLSVVFALGWYIGWHLHTVVVIKRLAENPEAVIAMLEELKRIHADEHRELVKHMDEPPEQGVEISMEQHSGQYYAFRKDTDQFIAQGASPEAVHQTLKDRYPQETFWYKKSDKEHQTA